VLLLLVPFSCGSNLDALGAAVSSVMRRHCGVFPRWCAGPVTNSSDYTSIHPTLV